MRETTDRRPTPHLLPRWIIACATSVSALAVAGTHTPHSRPEENVAFLGQGSEEIYDFLLQSSRNSRSFASLGSEHTPRRQSNV